MIKRCLAGLLSVLLLVPSVALAQANKAGVVTTLEGNVTARRVALPSAVSLKFKDDVFLQDTVTTGDKALARMLLGGKAVVTVRERSVLTITEVPGRTTIDLESGKFALAVAREKLRPGEEIQIRTPNAVAGVRGTVVVTEINRQTAQVGGAAPALVTNFYVLRGTITAQPLDPGTRQPLGAPLQVGTLQAYSQAGNATPRIAPVPPEQVGQITSGLSPTGPKGGSEAGQEQVKAQALQTAVTLLGALTGTDTQIALSLAPQAPIPQQTQQQTTSAPIVAFTGSDSQLKEVAAGAAAAATKSFPKLLTGTVSSSGETFNTSFTGTFTDAAVQLTNAIVTQTGADVNFIKVLSGGDVTLLGALLKFVNSSLKTDGKLLEIEGGKLKSTGTGALISLDPSSITTGDALIAMNGGTLTLAGALLTDTDGTISPGAEFVRMQNSAKLTGTGTGALVQLSGTTVGGSAALSMTDSSMSLAGALVSASNLKDGGDGGNEGAALFKLDASSITSTGTGTLLSFSSTNADPNGNFLRLVNASTITLDGPLFSATGGTFKSGLSDSLRAFFAVLDGSKITSTTSSALVSMTDATFDAQGPLFNVRRSKSTSSPSKVTLKGPLFSGTNTTINTTSLGFGSTFGTGSKNCCSVFGVEQGAELTSTTGSALISLSGSTVTVSDSQSGGSFFFVTDTVDGFPSSELVAPSTVTLAGPLLSATSSTIKPLFNLLGVFRSTVSSTTSSALISLTSSTVAAGGNDASGTATPFARMLTLLSSATSDTAASATSVSLAGPFMSATGSTLSGVQFAGIFNGASFKSTSTSALVSLDNTSLTLSTITQGTITERGHFLNIGGLGSTDGATFAKMTLDGPLLSVSNGSTLTLSGGLLNVFAGGQVTESHPTSAFVSISGGTHKIASDSFSASVPGNALFRLLGTATLSQSIDTSPLSPSGTSTLTLGTDEPLKRSGSGAFLEVSNATISTVGGSGGGGLVLDTALLSASAPLLYLKSGASLTTAAEGINLTAQAKLTATGPMVKIDGGTLTINSGSAINAAGGSFLNVTGDLVSMNGGTLNISSGAILKASGSSVIKISGGLVNFNSSAATINLTNNFCAPSGCTIINNVKFFFTNSGTSANVSVLGTPFKGTGSETVNLSNGGNTAHVVVDGAASKVIITGN